MADRGSSSKLAGVQQIAEEYGLAAWQIYAKIRTGIIPRGVFLRFGPKRVLIHRERWDEWIASGASAGEDHPTTKPEAMTPARRKSVAR